MGTEATLEVASAELARINRELSDRGLPSVNPKTFCILPFMQFSTTTDGEIRLCCRSRPVGTIASDSLGQMWRGDRMEQVRHDLTKGVRRSECQACWELEDLGMVSLRQGQNIQRAFENSDRIVSWLGDRQLHGPNTLELKLSNLCNLKCRMCSPISSTPWLKEWTRVKDHYDSGDRLSIQNSYDFQTQKREPVLDHFLTNTKFTADLAQFSDGIRELEFAGGEPLLDPLHYEVLEKVSYRASEITLKYSTNLMMLGTKRYDVMEFWRRFKKVKLTISIDGYPALNEYIRSGTITSTFERNLATVKELPNIELKGSTCVSIYNALELRPTFEYILSLGLIWHANRVRSPKFLDARILPAKLRAQAIANLKAFDPTVFAKLGITPDKQLRSLRTYEDCLSWLGDARPESSEQFHKFIAYKARLDEIRKTKMPFPIFEVQP